MGAGCWWINLLQTRPRQFGSGACETLFKPPHNYFHQCSGEKIHCPHVCHLTFRILNMRFKCFSANFSCLIVRFSAKSLSTSYAWFVYVLMPAAAPPPGPVIINPPRPPLGPDHAPPPPPLPSHGSQPPVTRSRARAVAADYFPVPDTPSPAQPPGLVIQPTSILIISGDSALRV